ncbi:kinase-like domain-containing protein [Armillaria fumosa]|nr:kinase-like domain-containing protein [Armillaria fumosa]
MAMPKITTHRKSTTHPVTSRPRLHSWGQINFYRNDVRSQIQTLIRDAPSPWITVELIAPPVDAMVMDILQQELDGSDNLLIDGYRRVCLKCLRALSKARNLMPASLTLSSRDVSKEGTNPITGGGFADIWKGHLHGRQVCLKVLRIHTSVNERAKLIQDFCREALVWRQLRHPNILPFLGVSDDLFAPGFCLISPWMVNGNIISYLEAHPNHNRLTSLIQIAEGMRYLHEHDPPIVHADIRGANVLVMDDLRCCLADFGLSLFSDSQAFDSSSGRNKGSTRWLAPEYMDSKLFNQLYFTARDVYAYGCTVIEIFTGKPPFSDIKMDAGVISEVLIKKSRPPRPSSNIFPDNGLWELVMACLSFISSQRPDATMIYYILAQIHIKTPFSTILELGRHLPTLPEAVLVQSALPTAARTQSQIMPQNHRYQWQPSPPSHTRGQNGSMRDDPWYSPTLERIPFPVYNYGFREWDQQIQDRPYVGESASDIAAAIEISGGQYLYTTWNDFVKMVMN